MHTLIRNHSFLSLPATALALLGGFVVGCTLTINEVGPCPTGSNNWLVTNADGEEECECRPGYTWCTDDTTDLDCCPIGDDDGGTGGDGDGDGDSGDGDGDGDGDACAPAEPPPADDTCDETTEGFAFCSNTEMDGVCGSVYYVCTGGVWVDLTDSLNDDCIADGFDFSFGCTDDGAMVVNNCGVGPGTDCSNADPASCDGLETLLACTDEKLTSLNCLDYCQTTEEEGGPFEYGECSTDETGAGCLCCNSGDEGCPI